MQIFLNSDNSYKSNGAQKTGKQTDEGVRHRSPPI